MPRRHRVRSTLAVVALLGVCLTSFEGAAQPGAPSTNKMPPGIRVHTMRDLRFGVGLPGVEHTVLPVNGDAGMYLIQASRNAEITVSFVALPSALSGTADTMPVRFEATSASIYFWKNGPVDLIFDPAVELTFTLGNTGSAWIFLGGIASPKGNQAPGDYSEPVTLEAEYASSPSS